MMPAKMPRRATRRGLCTFVALAGLLPACGMLGPSEPQLPIEGQVLDRDGQPLPGAVVSDGRASTLTDESGRFAFSAYEPAITAVKPGYRSAAQHADQGRPAAFRLEAAPATVRVGIDRRFAGDRLSGLSAYLAGDGHEVVRYPDRSLSSLDTLVMVTPGALDSQELSRLRTWVRAGGRLILCGEWGGFPAQDLAGLNDLAVDAGIRFTGATVKSSAEATQAEWLRVPGLAMRSLDQQVGGEGLFLFTCTSLAVEGGARPLFQSDRRAYSVMSRLGEQVLGAVGASGFGKVFAIGDSSLWLDEDSEGVGVANWQRGANRRLASVLVQW